MEYPQSVSEFFCCNSKPMQLRQIGKVDRVLAEEVRDIDCQFLPRPFFKTWLALCVNSVERLEQPATVFSKQILKFQLSVGIHNRLLSFLAILLNCFNNDRRRLERLGCD